jgi:hypothetical protein
MLVAVGRALAIWLAVYSVLAAFALIAGIGLDTAFYVAVLLSLAIIWMTGPFRSR